MRELNNKPFRLYRRIIRRANRKKLDYCKREEFINWYIKQKKICIYCGLPEEQILLIRPKNKTNLRLEIDRMNNNEGYLIDNICLACPHCNIVKNDVLTFKEMKFIGNKFMKLKHNKILGRII